MDRPQQASPRARAIASLVRAALLAGFAFVWLANSSGVLSSNDGSHLALARALVLRGHTQIDADRGLTLGVDLAEREGHAYSDRPPGTAFAALPAVWIGARLDPRLRERAVEQARAGESIDPLPGALPYISTYAARGLEGPALVELIASSIAASIHAALVGLLGLALVDALLRRLELGEPEQSAGARAFALSSLALASLWGPYSSALFGHVSAAAAVAGFLLGVVALARAPAAAPARTLAPIAALTGFAGAWAIACDYLLVLAIVPASALAIDWRRWPLVLLGTLPLVLATLLYHRAAFASAFAVGYDHQVNFGFARTRATTFSGSLGGGLWTLWGLGRDAGLLALSPVSLVGLGALIPLALRHRRQPRSPERESTTLDPALRRLLLALLGFLPWVLALALHRTPWGGGTGDHRYLIPILPFAAVGLALIWARASTLLRAALIALSLSSAWLCWRHFLAWHEGEPFARPGLGLAVAGVVFVLAAAGAWLRAQKVRSRALSW